MFAGIIEYYTEDDINFLGIGKISTRMNHHSGTPTTTLTMHHSPHHHGGGVHIGSPSIGPHHYNLPHHLPTQHHTNHLGSGLVTSTSNNSLHSSSMHHPAHSNGSNGSDDGSSVSSGTTSAAAAHAAAVAAAAAAAGGATELSFEDFTSMSPFLDPASLHLAAAASNPYASSLSATGRNLKPK